MVWRLAACKLGYDCSTDAQWYQVMCRFDHNCQPDETGVELIFRVTAGTYSDLDMLSDQLIEKLKTGDLHDLGWR